MEEPEAHLHPLLEDHLARNIEAVRAEHDTSMQLLITSHSTHIAARLSLENTAVMFQDSTQGRIASHYVLTGLDPVQDKPTIHYLSKYIDATKSRLFFARRIILVEGIAEQLLLPRFFELNTGRTLEQEGCNVINVAGLAFKHFLKVVRNGYFVRCLVLTDRDSGTGVSERAEELKRDYDLADLIDVEITQTRTFELDVIQANSDFPGADILRRAAQATRPQLSKSLTTGPLDAEQLFDMIKEHKAEFAFNLAAELNDIPCGRFQIPSYIREGFAFLRRQQ